jgi:cyclase
MLTKRIIPCLDVTNGRVVKGTNFVDLRDAGDPVELAHFYDQQGADELVFLDITASSDKRSILKELVARTSEKVFIPFTVGGGISDIETMRELLQLGADKISINTAAVKNPQLIFEASSHFGSQCIVVAIDVKRSTGVSVMSPISEVALDPASQFEVFTHGGRHPTGIDAIKWAQFLTDKGAGEILLTSMDKDGTKDGYDVELTQSIASLVKVPVIASGGAGALSHISDVLRVCDAALLASLLHFRELTVAQIKSHCDDLALPMRIL